MKNKFNKYFENTDFTLYYICNLCHPQCKQWVIREHLEFVYGSMGAVDKYKDVIIKAILKQYLHQITRITSRLRILLQM